MSLSTLSDVELIEESLRRIREYPVRMMSMWAVDAEMRARGTERMRAAIEEVGERREQERLANLCDACGYWHSGKEEVAA